MISLTNALRRSPWRSLISIICITERNPKGSGRSKKKEAFNILPFLLLVVMSDEYDAKVTVQHGGNVTQCHYKYLV